MEPNTTDLPPHSGHDDADMLLSQSAQYYLQQSGKWASFLGIVGFIGSLLLLMDALGASTLGPLMLKMYPQMQSSAIAGSIGLVLGGFYFVMAVVYFVFSLYLYQFGTRIKKGIAFINNDYVTDALGKLKSFFKFWGVLTIILIILGILTIIGLVAAAAMMGSHGQLRAMLF